jgi:DnaJ like chaperone protein
MPPLFSTRGKSARGAWPRFAGKWYFRAVGPLAGGIIGLVGGLPGLIIGLVMGYLLQELAGQLLTDRAVLAYFENPGRPGFNEGEPGLAAFCALGVIIGGQEAGAGRCAAASFAGGRSPAPLIESFCRLAASRRRELNPDLLAESLAARRAALGDLPALGKALHDLAAGDEALKTAAHIRGILDPGYRAFEKSVHDAAERLVDGQGPEDPWRILGLEPGAGEEEVKSGFRKLAIRYHPDSLSALSGPQQEAASRTFLKIKEAYQTIMDLLAHQPRG